MLLVQKFWSRAAALRHSSRTPVARTILPPSFPPPAMNPALELRKCPPWPRCRRCRTAASWLLTRVTCAGTTAKFGVFCLVSSDDNKTVADPSVPEPALAPGKKPAPKKEEKKKVVERSQIVLDVKPWEADADLEELARTIKAIQIDGLNWGEGHKIVPLAFTVKKLQVSCVIQDDKVLLDDITDAITAIEEYVQSVDVYSFNKL